MLVPGHVCRRLRWGKCSSKQMWTTPRCSPRPPACTSSCLLIQPGACFTWQLFVSKSSVTLHPRRDVHVQPRSRTRGRALAHVQRYCCAENGSANANSCTPIAVRTGSSTPSRELSPRFINLGHMCNSTQHSLSASLSITAARR